LFEHIWPDVFVSDGVLKVCVREIRQALGDRARLPRFIETVHRRGYRFIAATRDAQSVDVPVSRRVMYSRNVDVNIAYQVIGSGPIDLVFVMGWVSHLEYAWHEPSFARFLTRLASFSRLILFDKRGTGLSDPVTQLPTLEQRMQDVTTVLDAVGSRRAVLLGVSEGGPMCSLFAATYPARTEALVMIGSYARRTRVADYPWAPTEEEREAFCREILEQWGGPVGIHARAPTMAHDPAFREWWATYLRLGGSPATAVALTRMNAQIDIRHVLPTVRVPTLVLHRRGDRCLLVEEGRFVASRIPGARFVELPGDDHLPFVGDADAIVDEIERFVVNPRPAPTPPHRRLATIVSIAPVERSERSGDAIEVWQAMASGVASRFESGPPQRVGDRLILLFDGPACAIHCAHAIATAAKEHGMPLAMGVHAGECDLQEDGTVQGLALTIAQRLADCAGPGDVLVSRTVVDLVAGSGLRFEDRGSHALADGLETWRIYAASGC
jgi:pimeloyl-ACP methyl ester carboxylesterase